jgi:hypothetical protein
MKQNTLIRAIAVIAISFITIQLAAWAIRGIYFVINDLDNWALWVQNTPLAPTAFAVTVGVIYYITSSLFSSKT